MQIIVDGILTHYEDQGKGKVIILLHGWRDSAKTYDKLAAKLTENYRVIRLDLPNFGASASTLKVTTTEQFAQFIETFLKKMKVGSVYGVIGHSMGGQIAIYAAANGVVQTKKLVLLATAGIRNQKRIYKTVMKVASKPIRGLLTKNFKRKFYKAIRSDYGPDLSDELRAVIKNTLEFDIQADAAKITVPTMLIYGTDDVDTPPAFGFRLHELIADSRLELLENAGHHLQESRTDEVYDHIKKFLDKP